MKNFWLDNKNLQNAAHALTIQRRIAEEWRRRIMAEIRRIVKEACEAKK